MGGFGLRSLELSVSGYVFLQMFSYKSPHLVGEHRVRYFKKYIPYFCEIFLPSRILAFGKMAVIYNLKIHME